MASLAAIKYSQALFTLGTEENKLDVFKQNLIDIDQVILSSKELSQVMKHPKVEKADRKAVLGKVFKSVDPLIMNFLKLLVDRNRFQNIHDIKKNYVRLYNEYNGIEIAYIYSAQELSKEELDEIVTMLAKKRNKKVEYEMKIDPSLIAGIRVKIGDEILDNSIENQLLRMKETVAKQIL